MNADEARGVLLLEGPFDSEFEERAIRSLTLEHYPDDQMPLLEWRLRRLRRGL